MVDIDCLPFFYLCTTKTRLDHWPPLGKINSTIDNRQNTVLNAVDATELSTNFIASHK